MEMQRSETDRSRTCAAELRRELAANHSRGPDAVPSARGFQPWRLFEARQTTGLKSLRQPVLPKGNSRPLPEAGGVPKMLAFVPVLRKETEAFISRNDYR